MSAPCGTQIPGSGDPVGEGECGGSGTGCTAGDPELSVDVADVPLDRADAEHEFVRDLLVAQPVGDQPQDLGLARGEMHAAEVNSVSDCSGESAEQGGGLGGGRCRAEP